MKNLRWLPRDWDTYFPLFSTRIPLNFSPVSSAWASIRLVLQITQRSIQNRLKLRSGIPLGRLCRIGDLVPDREKQLTVLDGAAQIPVRLNHVGRFHHVYIEGFAGAGVHLSKTSQQFVPGSPLNALNVKPPFCECRRAISLSRAAA
jgi:hypothetical protein